MVKLRDGNENERAQVNDKLFSNFRDLYFTPNAKIWEELNSDSVQVIKKRKDNE